MQELTFRIVYVLRFVAFMAFCYMVLHAIVAPRLRNPNSKVTAFFVILTSPLTRPVRAMLGRGASDSLVRLTTLALVALVWLGLAILSSRLG